MVSRVLFINDSTPFCNWGGRGATTALRTMIEAAGADIVHTLFIDELETSRLDGLATTAPTEPPDPIKEKVKLFIPPIVLGARHRLKQARRAPTDPPLIPQSWGDFDSAARRMLGAATPWPNLLRKLRDVDVVVIFGDGDLYGNHLLPRTLLFLSYVLKRYLDIPVIMVAHSADFDHPALRRMAEHVYPLYDDVVFRDRISVERCRSICEGRFAPDPAFLYEPAPRAAWASLAGRPAYLDVWPDRAKFDPARPYICIGGSSLFDAADVDQVTREYARLLERLRDEYDGQLVLTSSDDVDTAILRPISRGHDVPLVGAATPVQQAVDVLGNADAYVGGRFHVAVYALRGGTPVIPLSAKTFKMQAITELAGLPSTPFTASAVGGQADQILQALLDALAGGGGLRARLSSWAEEMARQSWETVGFLLNR